MIDFDRQISDHLEVIDAIRPFAPRLEALAREISECLSAGGTTLWIGNGGSAGQCQHLAAEFVCRFSRERRGLPSLALTANTSNLTAIGNDYGFEHIFSRQIEALCRPGDIVFALSTSGNSPNVIAGLKQARKHGAVTVGFGGNDGGGMRAECDRCFVVPSPVTARIQEAHILMGHFLCDWVEESLVGD
jgi:D-sedoheptulose 7-phosphate isomerase